MEHTTFEIDPADFQLNVDRAKSSLDALDQQIETAKSQDAQLKFQVKAAEAAVRQATAERDRRTHHTVPGLRHIAIMPGDDRMHLRLGQAARHHA